MNKANETPMRLPGVAINADARGPQSGATHGTDFSDVLPYLSNRPLRRPSRSFGKREMTEDEHDIEMVRRSRAEGGEGRPAADVFRELGW